MKPSCTCYEYGTIEATSGLLNIPTKLTDTYRVVDTSIHNKKDVLIWHDSFNYCPNCGKKVGNYEKA